MRWAPGRQGSGYFKFLILQLVTPLFAFDWYILKFPEDSYVGAHIDPVDGMHHLRINIIHRAKAGGRFYKNGGFSNSRINIFRPDITQHGVSKVAVGTRYVLSFGFAVPKMHWKFPRPRTAERILNQHPEPGVKLPESYYRDPYRKLP